LLLAATLAAATVGGLLYAVGHRPRPIDKPVEGPRDVPPPSAQPGPGSPNPAAPLPGPPGSKPARP
jgi:hypothetical protein